MGRPGRQIAGFILTLIVALIFSWSFGQWTVSGQAQRRPGAPSGAGNQSLKQRFQWPVKPFHIIGNIYYVGLSTFDSYLIVTSQGNLMVDVAVPQEVRRSIEALAYRVKDIKYLLDEHAHSDRVLGLAQMKSWSKAKVLAMAGDVPALEEGGIKTNILPDMIGPVFPPVKVDRVIHDGDKVELGGTTMVAHLTAGHTAGCTTWTTEVEEMGKKYIVAIYGSCASLNNPLVGDKARPHIAEEYANQYKTLRSLHVDVPLGIESWEKMNAKAELMAKNPEMTNPFIDPKSWEDFVAKNEKMFEDQLNKENAGGGAYSIVVGASAPCPQDARACYNLQDLIMDCCAKIGAKYVGKD